MNLLYKRIYSLLGELGCGFIVVSFQNLSIGRGENEVCLLISFMMQLVYVYYNKNLYG